MIYHVEKVKVKTEADYKTVVNGVPIYFKYTSSSGRAAHKAGGMVHRTQNPSAVTCPECRTILELPVGNLEAEITKMEQGEQEEIPDPSEPPAE